MAPSKGLCEASSELQRPLPSDISCCRILPDFLTQHPEVQTEVELTNRRVDPVEEAFDLVVRVGAIEDTTMIAKNIGEVPFGLFASPKYLKRDVPLRRPMIWSAMR